MANGHAAKVVCFAEEFIKQFLIISSTVYGHRWYRVNALNNGTVYFVIGYLGCAQFNLELSNFRRDRYLVLLTG